MVVIYGLYTLSVYSEGNRYLTNPPGECLSSISYCNLKDQYSSYNATQPNLTSLICDWLGLAAMILWILISRVIKHYA